MASTNIQKPKIKNPKKEGYLEKQSSFWKTYRKRWMVLQGHMLYSFKEEKEYDNPTEIFDLRIYNKAKKSADGKTGQFELSSPNDSRIFLASSAHEMKDWIKYIKSASGKQKSASVSGLRSKKRNSANIRNNPNSITNKTKRKPKQSPKMTPKGSKKKGTKTKKKTAVKQSPKQTPKKHTKPKQKSQKVTNASMDRYIERMRHAKSKSHDTNAVDESPSKKKKKSTHKKTQKRDSAHQQRASVPNLLDQNYRQQTRNQEQQTKANQLLERPKSTTHNKSSSNMLHNHSGLQPTPHRRSVSSMFGRKSRPNIERSSTDLTDEEHISENNPRDFNLRSMKVSKSERNLARHKSSKQQRSHTPNGMQSHSHEVYYSVTFESKPFGLTLNPFDEEQQSGAVVMVNHNVNDQIISQSSRFISINNKPCKNYKFERIKNMCRNATLPTTIKFLNSQQNMPNAQSLEHSASDNVTDGQNYILSTNPNQNLKPNAQSINRYNNNAPTATSSYKKQNKKQSPRFSNNVNNGSKPKSSPKQKTIPNGGVKEDIVLDTPAPAVVKKKGKKKSSKPKESAKAKQNREKKAAKQLMESLGGMEDIKKAEKCERMRQWKECVDAYESGIENLEKSLKKLEISGILSQFQQKECQSQIDQYCRALIKLQRQHSKDIQRSNDLAKEKKAKKHARATTAIRSQKSKRNINTKRLSTGYTKPPKQSEYNTEEVNDEDETAVFGKKPKRESAVALKKKEMARMEREMKTGKIENPNGSDSDGDTNHKSKDNTEDAPDDIYSFLNKDESIKKHKDKMSGAKTTKKDKKKSTKKKDKKKKGKKKKKGSKENKDKKGGSGDDEKEEKKESKMSKQDQEFRSRLEADIIAEAPDICFKDVQGLASVKLALYETIILPQMRPELFTGLRTPTGGLLLFGPPGNGKTMIAKCVAAGCNSTFFSISASSITSKFVGDSERIMRGLFNLAREKSPSIIFIDEIDSMLTARGGKNEAESSRRIKTEFLIQFDGVKKASDSAKRVLVIGATNLPDQLDEAVLRRFGKRIMVPLPDYDTRLGILRLLMSKQKCEVSDSDYDAITKKCDGYSCSDLSTLCKDAAMGPIRSLGARILEISDMSDMPAIQKTHFDGALANVRPSLTQGSLAYFNEWNDKFGSKIHLSMSALPEDMRPYTEEELREVERLREEKEAAAKAAKEAAEKEEEESESEEESD